MLLVHNLRKSGRCSATGGRFGISASTAHCDQPCLHLSS